MYIDIPVTACLNLLRSHEKLLIQLLVQLIENQTSLGGHQCGIRICVFLIADIHDRLALLIHIVQHPDKVLLVIAVIPVAFRHHGLHLLQSALHDIMHHGNGNLRLSQRIHLVDDILADPALLFRGESGQCPVRALCHRIDHFLYIEGFPASVLLYHIYIPVRSECFSVIDIFSDCLIKIASHLHHSLLKL